MSKSRVILSLCLLATPWLAHASCESTKEQIAQKIQANGVKHFALKIVPADGADQAGGKVVGNCRDESKSIVYIRGGSSQDDDGGSDDDSAPASGSSAQ